MVGLSDGRIDQTNVSSVLTHPTILPSSCPTIYHFDLYRLEDYTAFVSIGGEEILEDTHTICLIEWPEILGDTVKYTKKISIEVMEDGKRKIIYEQ